VFGVVPLGSAVIDHRAGGAQLAGVVVSAGAFAFDVERFDVPADFLLVR
jgi:hypothetical protein